MPRKCGHCGVCGHDVRTCTAEGAHAARTTKARQRNGRRRAEEPTEPAECGSAACAGLSGNDVNWNDVNGNDVNGNDVSDSCGARDVKDLSNDTEHRTDLPIVTPLPIPHSICNPTPTHTPKSKVPADLLAHAPAPSLSPLQAPNHSQLNSNGKPMLDKSHNSNHTNTHTLSHALPTLANSSQNCPNQMHPPSCADVMVSQLTDSPLISPSFVHENTAFLS